MKVSDTIWVIFTHRGNIFAAGPDAKSAIISAVRKHKNSPALTEDIVGYFWNEMASSGYKCISTSINVDLTEVEVLEQQTLVKSRLQTHQVYDP